MVATRILENNLTFIQMFCTCAYLVVQEFSVNRVCSHDVTAAMLEE